MNKPDNSLRSEIYDADGNPMGYATERNEFGQPIDEKGHVLKTREIIAKELQQLEFAHDNFQLNYWDDDELKVLVDYIMSKIGADYAASVTLGIGIGRREAMEAFKAKVTK
jgi:hypothetical protein